MNKTAILRADVFSVFYQKKAPKLLGKKGEPVKITGDHGSVQIVVTKSGVSFPAPVSALLIL